MNPRYPLAEVLSRRIGSQWLSLPSISNPWIGREQSLPGKIFLAVTASLFVAGCAHISLPLLFTPVPLTLSNFAVLLVGMFLGPRVGFAALSLYLVEGAMGLPVFTPGGLGGVAQLLGPTGGYLFAYPLAAALAGWMVSRQRLLSLGRFPAGLLASILATALVMTGGILWLASATHLPVHAAVLAGLIPFLPGEAMKVVIAAGLFRTLGVRRSAPETER